MVVEICTLKSNVPIALDISLKNILPIAEVYRECDEVFSSDDKLPEKELT